MLDSRSATLLFRGFSVAAGVAIIVLTSLHISRDAVSVFPILVGVLLIVQGLAGT